MYENTKKPAAVKKKLGTYRKNRDENREEIRVDPVTIGSPPEELNDREKFLWNEGKDYLNRLKIIGEHEVHLYLAWCKEWAAYFDLLEEYEDAPLRIKVKLSKALNEAQQRAIRLSRSLFMTPLDRVGVTLDYVKAKKSRNDEWGI